MCLLLSLTALSQTPTFDRTYAIPETSGLYLQATSDGGFLCYGEKANHSATYPLRDALVFQVNSAGDLEWDTVTATYQKLVLEQATHITRGPGAGISILNDLNDFYSFDANGVVTTQQDWSSSMQYSANAMARFGNGAYQTAGPMFGIVPEKYIEVNQFDPAGSVAWTAIVGQDGDDRIHNIVPANGSGSLLLSTFTPDPFNQPPTAALYRLDSAGTVLWEDTVASVPTFTPMHAVQLPTGTWMIAGFVAAGTDTEGCLVAMSDTGTLLWHQLFPDHEFPNQIRIADDGNIAIAGSVDGPDSDWFLNKLDHSGTLLWSAIYPAAGSAPNSIRYLSDMIALDDNGFALIGSSRYLTESNPVIIRTNSQGQQEPVGIGQSPQRQNSSLYPNPASQGAAVTVTAPTGATVALYDVTGKWAGSYTATGVDAAISTDNLPSGMYLVAVTTATERFTHRLIVQ